MYAGLGFIASYMLSYVAGTMMTNRHDATTLALTSGLSTVLPMVFWYSFKSANKWAGGAPYANMDLIWTWLSLPLVLAGIYFYQKSFEGAKFEPGSRSVSTARVPMQLE